MNVNGKKNSCLHSIFPCGVGASRDGTVHLYVPATDLAYYEEATSQWRIEPIGYTAIVGRHALDPNALRTDFRVV